MSGLYFIRVGSDGPIKVGSSFNADTRLRALQIGNPVRLELLGFVAHRGWEEPCWHAALRDWRLVGEWFESHPALLDAIRIAADHGPWWEKLPTPESFVAEHAHLKGEVVRDLWVDGVESEIEKAWKLADSIWSARRDGKAYRPIYKKNRQLYRQVWQGANAA